MIKSKYLIAVSQDLSGILSGTFSFVDLTMKYFTTTLFSSIYIYILIALWVALIDCWGGLDWPTSKCKKLNGSNYK